MAGKLVDRLDWLLAPRLLAGERAVPVCRGAAPAGASILTTSAPMSPSICVASGPATTEVRSRMRTPLKGPVMVGLGRMPG